MGAVRMSTTDRVLQFCAGIGAVVAAVVGLWNAYQYAKLTGVVGQISETLLAHMNAANLH